MKIRKIALIAALALSAASGAQADDLSIQYVQTQGIKLTTTATSNYLTGVMQFDIAGGGSFLAFCAEVGQSYATAAQGMQTYTLGSFSGAQADLLQGLFSSSYAGLNSAQDFAAFQTAVWEITSETSNTLNVGIGAGTFYTQFLNASNGAPADPAQFIAQTNSYLAAAQSYEGTALYQLNKLSNGQYQDYVTATPVPEPSSYAMMLAGLCAIGAIARRRKPQQ